MMSQSEIVALVLNARVAVACLKADRLIDAETKRSAAEGLEQALQPFSFVTSEMAKQHCKT